MRWMMLCLMLVTAAAPAAVWFTRTYDARIYDWCVDAYGTTSKATTCMREETKIARESADYLAAEVRGDADQRQIYDTCSRKTGHRGQRSVLLCVRSEVQLWRRRN